MKLLIRSIIASLLAFILISSVNAQEKPARDKYTLLTEPFNIRTLTSYQGQIAINAGYRLGLRTKSYDDDGELISLSEDGTASVINNYLFNISYGITDFIEVGAVMNYTRKGVREKTYNYFNIDDFITLNTLTEWSGFEDAGFWLSVRPPVDFKLFDIMLRGGITLPTANSDPPKPEHTSTWMGGLSYLLDYHYFESNGMGVPVWSAGGAFKLRLDKFSLVISGNYSVPMREQETYRWSEYMIGDRFYYTREYYTRMPGIKLDLAAEAHFQATGWLDLRVGFNSSSTTEGWTERFDSYYALPESSLAYLEPGLEIQVSPLIRLTESAAFAIGGTGSEAPFFILTSLSFNMMPFIK